MKRLTDLADHHNGPIMETLLAQPDGAGTYRFDLVLQGTGETVFFAL